MNSFSIENNFQLCKAVGEAGVSNGRISPLTCEISVLGTVDVRYLYMCTVDVRYLYMCTVDVRYLY